MKNNKSMTWYNKYLEIYNKPFTSVAPKVIEEIRGKLKKIQSGTPIVSVVLIAYNEEPRILSCLWSLCENLCDFPLEILTVNNNSTDKTSDVLDSVGATWINEEKKGPGHARQCGLNHARGVYHICIDADTIYPPRYIETHVRELMKPEIACTFGLWSFIPGKEHSQVGLFVYEMLRDIHLHMQAFKRPELCVRGMVFGFKTEFAKKIGFRTDILRGEDGSMALAMKPFGKLKFITSRQARVMTSSATLDTDGSLFNSLKNRIIKAMEGIAGLFFKKTEYKDEDSNLLK